MSIMKTLVAKMKFVLLATLTVVSQCWLIGTTAHCTDEVCDSALELALRPLYTQLDTLRHQLDAVKTLARVPCNEALPASCKAYIESGRSHGSGYYNIQPGCAGNQQLTVYCDQESNGGGWMRFYQKTGASECSGYNFTWTGDLVQCMGLDTDTTGYAVSDDVTTLNTENSWILSNSSWEFDFLVKCFDSPCRNREDLPRPHADVIASLANCKTPSDDAWSQDYQDGYARIRGTLETNGCWTRMFQGCGAYADIGDSTSFRMGGGPAHTGEFIHGHCNDYTREPQHRVTSRWNWDNVRTIWIKTN